MVEIAVSVAASVTAKVAEYLVAPIARQFSYIWNYKTNFDNLKTEVRKLEGQRDTVQHSVEEARRNGEQIEQHVIDWLDRVKTLTDEVSEVNGKNERADMKCFKGLCPNPKKRHQHSRKAVKKTEAVARLYDEGSFPTVGFRTIPEEIWIPSHKGYMVFESRMSILKNILDELSNPDVNMVGIYGAGGIGKTTLAREISQHAEDKKLFNVVAFSEVAVKPDIKEIQKEIADKLGLTFTSEESVSGRARRLQQRLKDEEKVLLVLDNIWERLNLEDVGIPFGNDHKGCKLLLTARDLDVLSKMESQRDFVVGFLDKGEAWSLFEKKAGSCDHLQALAENVAEACGGLPIAIDSVAVALKNKEEFEWKDALTKLTTPSAGSFEGVAAETYSSIEISYSQLKEKELKSTFLLCCNMEYTGLGALLEYGVGLGIFEDVNTMEKARNRVNTLVRKLRDSSLLLDIKTYRFSLHDVVRDVGRSIASRDGHMFVVAKNCIPREWVGKDILKNCVGISLYNISKLPEEFECPELQFFYLRTTYSEYYSRVPDNFFTGMPKLKVLHLEQLELYSVTNSIRLLVNLRTLYIYNCKLRDVDFIGVFKQLEILRIRSSYDDEIVTLPKKMCNLTGLRLLDLNGCYIINIPPNVLSTYTRLEELYLPAGDSWKCKIKWEVEGVNILDELKHLKHLTTLKIGIADANVLPKGCFLLKKLERYDILIGNYERGQLYRWNETSRNVILNLETSSCSDDVQKFLSVLDGRGLPELEHLHVKNSPCFRAIVDCFESESCHHFLSLQSLSLHSVLNLEMIHSYPLKDKADSFRQLRSIRVEKCNKLKNILSFSTYRALPLLQEVNVSSCDNMEEIFAIRGEEDINNIEGTDQIEFKHLSSLTLTTLPKLTSFCSINNNKDMLDTPSLLFNQKVSFSSLEVIEISEMDDLEMIWSNQLCKDSFCNLKSLKVTKCNKLLTIFQSNMLKRILRLESLTICDCDLVEEIFDLQGIDFEESHFEVESRLRNLVIESLPKLKHIWNKDPQKMFSFQKLNNVVVRHCTSLKYLFPVSIAESLSELEQLNVCNCGLEEFVADDQGEAKVAATFAFPRITSLELDRLPQLETFYRGVHTSQWQNLKRLFMRRCDKVELFASELFNFQEYNEGQHGSSVQPLFIVEKVTFPSLEEIKIIYSNNLKIFWQKGAKESFCNLKSMEVNGCNEGLSMPKSLTVTISKCPSVEEIFDLQKVNFEESHSRPVTNRLQELHLDCLPKLKHIWKKDPQAKLSFEELPMPESLTVKYCDSIEEVFDLQMVNFEESPSRAVPCRLQELNLNGLQKLKHIWKKDPQAKLSFEELPMPKSLKVQSCDSIEEIFDLQNVNFEESHSRPVTYRLQELYISGLRKLKHIWKKDPQAKLSFEELPMPKSLKVQSCDSIEEIFDLQNVNFEESHSRPVTYRLQELYIFGLRKLKHIWKKDTQAKLSFEELPMPESLTVNYCDSIEEVFDLQMVNFEESPSRAVPCRLQELNLYGLQKLKHIWKKDPQAKLSFEELPMPESLTVNYCDSIEEVFDLQLVNFEESPSRAVPCRLQELNLSGLRKLKHIWKKDPQAKLSFEELPMPKSLKVQSCDSIEEIFDLQNVNFEESHSRPVTYRLQELYIFGLRKLKHIWKKDTQAKLSFEELPMPESLTVNYCDSIEEVFDLQMVNFEESPSRAVPCRLQELNLNGLQKLKHIWKKDPQAKLSFEELPMPESLTVNYCDSIEEVFDLQLVNFEESPSRAVPCRLQELNLNGLRKLKHIWKKDPQAKLSFEELPMPKSLKVQSCDSIEEIFDLQNVNFEESHSRPVTYRLQELYISGLRKLKHIWKKDPQAKLSFEELPMPKSLKVQSCDSIEEIFDLQKVNFEESPSRPVTYRLQELDISGLRKLKHIWKKDPQAKLSFEELPMPKSLKVQSCDSIEEIFDLQKVNFEESHSRPVTNRLQELHLDCLPKLKHIWKKDPQAELSFENLQKVDVSNCESLKDLFPASIARSLLQLVELNVYECGKLEEIVAKEGEAKEAARFVFPKVTSIMLNTLPELRTFYRGVHSSKWEVLKELEVVGCDKIELLASQLSCFQENNIEESSIDISVQPPFFLIEKDSFPILENLILSGKGAARMISQGQFSKELFCNLKFLQVGEDESVVLFPLRILQRFHHLHELHLYCNSYKEIFSYDETHVGVDSKLDMVLSKLEKLTVDECQNLIQLVPSSTSFQNLTVLEVCRCHRLKNLMTSSTAKSLVQLREMKIHSCDSIIEVVAKGGDVTEDKIIFSKLRTLRLYHLPSLSGFCSENYTFELPSLEEIIVCSCPEMKYFSLGDVTTRILQKVKGGFVDYTLEGDLNTTIQKTHNQDYYWDQRWRKA